MMKRIAAWQVRMTTLVLLSSAAMAGPLPGETLEDGARACFELAPQDSKNLDRLLVELHKEIVNEGDAPVIWAGVYAEKKGEPRPGFNRDGCSPHEPGSTEKLDHLVCGFSCDGGTLLVKQQGSALAITPQDLFLRSCGVGEDQVKGFLLKAEDIGGTATVEPVDDAECRKAMAPMEKIIEDYENGIN
jgi:hypothetical protein